MDEPNEPLSDALDSETIDAAETELVDASPDGERQDGAGEAEIEQPFHSTRSSSPGPRGCWAISKTTGLPCGAARRHGEDFCNAHAGHGVASDPRAYLPKAQEAQKRNRAIRAQMRLQLGNTRPTGPRAALQAMAMVESKRLASSILDAALDPDADPLRRGALALRVIDTVDPFAKATVEVSGIENLTPEDVDKLSYAELIALAQATGMEIPEGLPIPAGLPGATEGATAPPHPSQTA